MENLTFEQMLLKYDEQFTQVKTDNSVLLGREKLRLIKAREANARYRAKVGNSEEFKEKLKLAARKHYARNRASIRAKQKQRYDDLKKSISAAIL